jgi:hypothetical protein
MENKEFKKGDYVWDSSLFPHLGKGEIREVTAKHIAVKFDEDYRVYNPGGIYMNGCKPTLKHYPHIVKIERIIEQPERGEIVYAQNVHGEWVLKRFSHYHDGEKMYYCYPVEPFAEANAITEIPYQAVSKEYPYQNLDNSTSN